MDIEDLSPDFSVSDLLGFFFVVCSFLNPVICRESFVLQKFNILDEYFHSYILLVILVNRCCRAVATYDSCLYHL